MEAGTMEGTPPGALADDDPLFNGQSDPGPQDVHGGDDVDGDGGLASDADAGELFDGEQYTDPTFEGLVGGKSPTTDKVRLYGGAVEVEPPEGGFKKGRSYVLRVEVKCFKAGFTDELDDATGQVVGCSDERGLKIRGVALVDEDVA